MHQVRHQLKNGQQADGSAERHLIYFIRLPAKRFGRKKFDQLVDFVFTKKMASGFSKEKNGYGTQQQSAPKLEIIPAVACLWYKSTHDMDWIPLNEKMIQIQSAQQTFPLMTRIDDQQNEPCLLKFL